jgi:ligand-binding SRPBCC domain-containing protein
MALLSKTMMSLEFKSKLKVPRETLWKWITSTEGISAELSPLVRMTTPKGIESLNDLEVKPNTRLFRSYILLFGFVPMDFSNMTIQELNENVGFIEKSPMGSMKSWRHERRIDDDPSDPTSVILVDRLDFEPRIAKKLAAWFVQKLFENRHRVLRKQFG